MQGKSRPITIDGVTKPLSKWLTENGVSSSTFYNRMKAGMTEEEALTRKPSGQGRKKREPVKAVEPEAVEPETAAQEAPALLPCPFCGETPRADVDAIWDGDGLKLVTQVACSCGVKLVDVAATGITPAKLRMMVGAVYDRWNRRRE